MLLKNYQSYVCFFAENGTKYNSSRYQVRYQVRVSAVSVSSARVNAVIAELEHYTVNTVTIICCYIC